MQTFNEKAEEATIKKLTEETYLFYAAKNYYNPQCVNIQEFRNDMKGLVYARTLLRNYIRNNDLHLRLLLNHVIIFTNLFGHKATVRLFFFKCEEELYPVIKSLFSFLNILPDHIPEVNLSEIQHDINILDLLEKL